MVFSSITFLYYFLPIVVIGYFLVSSKYKNLVLFLSSIVFYFLTEPRYIVVLFLEITLVYFIALLIPRQKSLKWKNFIYYTTLGIILLVLIIFKYSNFIIEIFNGFKLVNLPFLSIVMPIGISFYTFQLLSYLIDVKVKEEQPCTNYIDLMTYIMLFPQLIAGPIIRYQDIKTQLKKREISIEKVTSGIKKFVIGLSKKVLLANSVAYFVSNFHDISSKTFVLYWLYAMMSSLQIYFDFSGYSDMAIGISRMFGFDFKENFNYPYISCSIKEFFKRWHISLSTWLKDYVYIPLGGSRVAKLKIIRNILITWCLTGLWHGASYNFLLWGVYFAILLIMEKFVFNKIIDKVPKFGRYLLTMFLVMISFVIFNGTDMGVLVSDLKGLFGINVKFIDEVSVFYLKDNLVLLIVCIISMLPWGKDIYLKLNKTNFGNKLMLFLDIVLVLLLLVINTAFLISDNVNPFIYFRF